MFRHSLFRALRNLRGNARGCVYTEPLWGIPFNLYSPYVSVYMLSLGMTDSLIGTITSIGLIFEIFWTLISGPITDKLGRRRTTLIFDTLSWSIPCLIWAIAQDWRYFVIAAIVNSIWRVTMNSWQCLLVEDTDPALLVDIWTWIYISGLLAAFVSPITGLLIDKFSLIPTMRGLYLLSFVMMTIKFLATNAMTTETQQGRVRMQETKDQPLFEVLRGSPQVLQQILRTPATMFTAGLMIIVGIAKLVRGTFWSILVTEKLQIPAQHLALYPFARSVAMLLFFFVVTPRLRDMDVRKPMIVGFLGLLASHLILISVPPQSYGLLLLATVLEAWSLPIATTLIDKLVAVTVDAQERARILGILYAIVIVCTAPFGWIAGRLSEINRSLPFVLNIALFGLGAALVFFAGKHVSKQPAPVEMAEQAVAS